jgi:hypothetical protein
VIGSITNTMYRSVSAKSWLNTGSGM